MPAGRQAPDSQRRGRPGGAGADPQRVKGRRRLAGDGGASMTRQPRRTTQAMKSFPRFSLLVVAMLFVVAATHAAPATQPDDSGTTFMRFVQDADGHAR